VQRDHRELGLWRAYFSAFTDQPAEDPTRALRPYQSDFMPCDYGFRYDELPFDADGLLPRDRTPKEVRAERNLHEPVELNRAPRQQLLRIPGIGPKSADKIMAARRERRLRDLSQLKALGVATGWAAPYVLLDGRRSAVQSSLW
jgi:predicted DNA-binding helix-hairpin-helix protein